MARVFRGSGAGGGSWGGASCLAGPGTTAQRDQRPINYQMFLIMKCAPGVHSAHSNLARVARSVGVQHHFFSITPVQPERRVIVLSWLRGGSLAACSGVPTTALCMHASTSCTVETALVGIQQPGRGAMTCTASALGPAQHHQIL